MNRRAFLRTMSVSVLASPVAVAAQQDRKIARVGLLGSDQKAYRPLEQGLSDLGWVEGRTLVLERRYTHDYNRMAMLARELVALRVDVIVGSNAPAVAAAKSATRTIPIVMAPTGDPVSAGFASSLARPGGNITGVAIMHTELSGKRLELLTAAVPNIARIAVMANPENPSTPAMWDETEGRARALGVTVVRFEATATEQFSSVLGSIVRQRLGALVVLGDPFFFRHSQQLVRLALQHRLPAIYEWRAFAEAGGLMAYGPNLDDLRRRAAAYVDKLLKGVPPGELPIEQPEKFELVVNLKTARAFGLTIPPSLLVRADQVIE
jgi:putative ABC transport system substrate-binding protein